MDERTRDVAAWEAFAASPAYDPLEVVGGSTLWDRVAWAFNAPALLVLCAHGGRPDLGPSTTLNRVLDRVGDHFGGRGEFHPHVDLADIDATVHCVIEWSDMTNGRHRIVFYRLTAMHLPHRPRRDIAEMAYRWMEHAAARHARADGLVDAWYFEPHWDLVERAVDLLLAAGANINARDATGRTAVEQAVNAAKNDTMRILVARGADIRTQTPYCLTATEYAAGTGNAAAFVYLVHRGAPWPRNPLVCVCTLTYRVEHRAAAWQRYQRAERLVRLAPLQLQAARAGADLSVLHPTVRGMVEALRDAADAESNTFTQPYYYSPCAKRAAFPFV